MNKLNLKSDEGINAVELSFLLGDRNLLKTHSGIVVDRYNQMTIFTLGSFASNKHEVAKFLQPYPWGEEASFAASAESSSDRSKKNSMTISCQESTDFYTIRLNFRSGKQLSKSGMQSTRQRIDCDKYCFLLTDDSIVLFCL